MVRRMIACLVLLLAAVPGPARAGHTATASVGDWIGEPTFLSGTSRYDRGEWIYTDYVYDDYGADTIVRGQPNVVSLAPTAGDFRYPNGTTSAGNAADIVEVRARIHPTSSGMLQVRVLLQSIQDPGVPAVWLDQDGVVSILTALNADVDAASNTITFSLPNPGEATTSIAVGAGLHDGSGGLRAGSAGSAYTSPGVFTTGGPTDARLFDLAFNTAAIEGRGGAWNEDAQSAALAAGALAPFAQTIDLDALAQGRTTPVVAEPGYHVRIFASRQDLGEGMASSFPQYRGRWQPYALWIPAEVQGPTPLLLNLHSLSVHHNQYRGGSAAGASYATMYEQIEAGIGAFVATPLGRGPDGWYEDEGLIDALEVWADVLASYPIDRERTSVAGYSMGGYGTYRLATMMPDAFASAVSIVGPPANGIWAYPLPPTGGAANPDNTQPQLESTRHIPFWITQGVLDELVPFAGVVNHAQVFGALGHEYRFALHPAEDHLSFVFKDEWSREVGWLAAHPTRVTDPARITLDVRPASWATGGRAEILAHLHALIAQIRARVDGAYWVDDVVVDAGTDVTGVVDLTSGGIARRQTGVAPVVGPGIDGPSPYVLTGQDQVTVDGSLTDELSGHLSGVVEVSVDLARAGLSDAPSITVTSDRPATIVLVRNGTEVARVALG